LVELQSEYEKIKSLGAEVLVISVDDAAGAAKAATDWELDFPVLYDDDNSVSIEWEVFDLLGDDVAAPAAYVFDGSGELVAYKIGENIADRPSTDEIISVLENGRIGG
jgi:peroxiredoxin